MTNDKLKQEHAYRYQERLGILCGTDAPTPDQEAIAKAEADKAIEELKAKATMYSIVYE